MRQPDLILDTTGLVYPMPLLRARKALTDMAPGTVLEVVSEDPALGPDIAELARRLGHELIEVMGREGRIHFYVRKGSHAR